MSVPEENKLLVRNETPNQKISTLVRFQNKIFTTCQISNQLFTARQNLKQKFHNMSDFKSKILQRVRFCFEKFCKKSDFARKCASKKSRFD